MIINVGSVAPPKIAAVKEAISDWDFLKGANVVGLQVSSGVSHHPQSLEETTMGARIRAINSFSNGATYSIGLESGFIAMPYAREGVMDIGVCVIYDGKNFYPGLSGAFELPAAVTRLIRQGRNGSEAAKEAGLTQHEYLGHDIGMIGLLTHGKILRKDQVKQSVQMALIRLANKDLYK